METTEVQNKWILKKYTRTGKKKSDLNPKKGTPNNKRYAEWDYQNIFYIVKCPDSVGGYKLGKARIGQTDMPNSSGKLDTYGKGGGGRLRSYWNAYGYAEGFYIHTVYTFVKRQFNESGEEGSTAFRWADSVFERLVKAYLTGEMNVLPIRGSEYFEFLEDIQEAVSEVLKEFTFVETVRRFSDRLKDDLKNRKEREEAAETSRRQVEDPKEKIDRVKPGIHIQVRWGGSGAKHLYDGKVISRVKDKVAVWNVYIENKWVKGSWQLNLNKTKFYDENLSPPFSWKFTSYERLNRRRRAITIAKIAENPRARRAISTAKVADKEEVARNRRERTRGKGARARVNATIQKRRTRSQTQQVRPRTRSQKKKEKK